MLPVSFDPAALQALFAKHPQLLPLAETTLLALHARYPDSPITVQGTQVKLGLGAGFCWVWPPLRHMKGAPKVCIHLSFGLRRNPGSPRILAAANPYKDRWTLHTALTGPDGLDGELLAWLDEAKAVNDAAKQRRR